MSKLSVRPIPAAATLWRCLVRDFTTPSHTLVATYR